jgi:hypothetical protein
VRRADDALIGVAAIAAEQRVLLVLGAGHADQPFGIGHLQRQALRLLQLEIGAGTLARGDIGGTGAVEVVAGSADRQAVMAGLELGRRKAVLALVVADDRDADRRALLMGGDHTPSMAPSSAEAILPANAASAA